MSLLRRAMLRSWQKIRNKTMGIFTAVNPRHASSQYIPHESACIRSWFVPYVVVTVFLMAIKSSSVPNCSYCLTIYTPHDSLNYHSTLNLSYFDSQKSAVYVFDFSCQWKESRFRKRPFFISRIWTDEFHNLNWSIAL